MPFGVTGDVSDGHGGYYVKNIKYVKKGKHYKPKVSYSKWVPKQKGI